MFHQTTTINWGLCRWKNGRNSRDANPLRLFSSVQLSKWPAGVKKLKRKKVLESRSGDLEEKIWPIHHAVACFFLFPHYNSFAPFVGRLDVVSTHLFPHSSHRSCRKREWLSSRRRGNSSPALSVSRVDDSVAFPNVCHRGGCQARRFFPPLAKVRTGIVRRDAIIR